jgi:subtilase family serine protease
MRTLNSTPSYSYSRLALWAILGFVFLCNSLIAQTRSPLTRHLRPSVADGRSALLNRVDETQFMRLSLVLPLRNEEELDRLLQDIYDPQSPLYHQFLSVEDFTERFGPSQQDYEEVLNFARKSGLTATHVSANRLVVSVEGSVDTVERAFHVHVNTYWNPAENRTFFAADGEPATDLGFSLWHISGLDNFSVPHPIGLRHNVESIGNATGSGPEGNFTGSDIRRAYYGGGLTGLGQSVALVEFAGYNLADVDRYFSKVGQKRTVPVNGVSTDGSRLTCSGACSDTEQALDIESAISMAPGMSQVRVYVSDTSDVNILNRIATENVSKSIACSWGWSPADPTSNDPIFKEYAAQGQSFFAAAGDKGSYKTGVRDVYPADNPYVTSVGGTNLTTTGPGGTWKAETAWSGSGGGISPNKFALPSYQKHTAVLTVANKASKVYRNAPDVAAEANTDNFICFNGSCAGGWGGTSFAAPRWATLLSLANQQSVLNGRATLGFINPILYAMNQSSRYASLFHDITSGTNGSYTAVKGYDLVTGWGTPKGDALIDALTP